MHPAYKEGPNTPAEPPVPIVRAELNVLSTKKKNEEQNGKQMACSEDLLEFSMKKFLNEFFSCSCSLWKEDSEDAYCKTAYCRFDIGRNLQSLIPFLHNLKCLNEKFPAHKTEDTQYKVEREFLERI